MSTDNYYLSDHDQSASTAGITAVLLAGGRGSRMGGLDKGLQPFNDIPLALHQLLRLQMQTLPIAHVIINANRNLDAYEALGDAVYPDTLPDFAGPLAGFMTGLAHCDTPLLLTLPCDCPLFPLDLAERLHAALLQNDAEIAMASAPEEDGTLRPQPVFTLLRAHLQDSLVAFTQHGGRKIDAWTAQHRTVLVPFNQPGDDPRAFFNANTLDELRGLERKAP